MTDTQSPEQAQNASDNVGVASNKPLQKKKKGAKKGVKKIVKYCLVSIAALLIIVLMLAYYLLSTTSGLKNLIGIASRYSGYHIEAREITGQLINKAELKQLTITGKNLSFSSDSVSLRWQSDALLSRSLTITDIIITDSVLELSPSQEEQPVKKTSPFELSDIDLPVGIRLENLLIENLALQNPVTKKADVTFDRIHVDIDYVGQKGTIKSMTIAGEGLDLHLAGSIETKGDFPLVLSNKNQYKSAHYGEENVDIAVHGSLKKALAIDVTGSGVSDFTVRGEIISLLKSPAFNVGVDIRKVDTSAFGFPHTATTAHVTARGALADTLQLETAGEIVYDSPETEKISLAFKGNIADNKLHIPLFSLGLLTAQQKLTGQATYGLDDTTLAVKLHSDALQWPQKTDAPGVLARELNVDVSGTLDNFHLAANTQAHTDIAGVVPVKITANGSQQSISDVNATATLNGQPLTLAGSATWGSKLDYTASISAPEIKAFREFPNIQNLALTVSGDDKSYTAEGGVHIAGKTIPPSDISLNVKGTPQLLSTAKLSLDSLGGTTTIDASGTLSPVDISAKLLLDAVQPHTFYPHVDANINGTVNLSVKSSGDDLTAVASIDALTGQVQKKPLSGKGSVAFDSAQQRITVDDIDLTVGGNRLQANGRLALSTAGTSDIKASVNANHLNNIVPSLGGSLVADLHATGALKQPEIAATVEGNNLAYQQHRVRKLKTALDISLSGDKLVVKSDVSGITTGAQSIDSAMLDISGKLSQHRIAAKVLAPAAGAIPSLELQARGALDIDAPQWSGRVNQLAIDDATVGRWQLAQASPLTLSADNVGVESLCMQQQSSRLCATGALKQNSGQFELSIKQLKTKQFAKLFPPTVALDTTINGAATLQLKDAQPSVKGKITAEAGSIDILTGSGGLSDRIQKLETAFELADNRLEAYAIGDLKKVGTLKVKARVPDISANTLEASAEIDSPNLAFIEELTPQLSEVKGKLTGAMTVSGDPSKQLKVAGKITLHKTNFDVPQFGTQIRGLTLDIFAKDGNQIGFKGGARAGGGSFTVNGNLNPANRQGEIDLKGKNFQIADSRQFKIAINPDVQILFADNIQVRGTILVPKALIVPSSNSSKITASEDVVLPTKKAKKQPKSSPIDIELAVKLGKDVRIASADIETRLLGGINVLAKPGKALFANGVISVKTGALRVYGQQLNIRRGRVIFSNGPIANPALDIRATRNIDAEDVVVGVNVLGNVRKPEISLFSTPSMPDSSILSYLLFGKPPSSDTFSSTALLQTGGLVGANKIARDIKSSTGLDVLDFSLSGVEVGKNLNKKIYVGVRTDIFNAINQFLLDYKVSSRTYLHTTIGTDGISGDLIKEIETD